MSDTDGSSIGCFFRSERLRRGKPLDVIAAETKISRAILEAIENDQFDSLPGGAYRREFVRQYARSIGLNEEDAVAAFRREYLEIPVPLPPVPPKRPLKHLREAGFLLLLPLAILGFDKVAGNEYSQREHSARTTSLWSGNCCRRRRPHPLGLPSRRRPPRRRYTRYSQ